MIDVVIPTIGRASLVGLLRSLCDAVGPRPGRIILVDDRHDASTPLELGDELDAADRARITIVRGRARGPAAARNDGWRTSRAPWIAFLDDDVIVDEFWLADLDRDIRWATDGVAGITGRVTVPQPGDRRATDWERNVAGLAAARWITADCAYRRAELLAAGGFDERFPRAFREDADLALRIIARGRTIVEGSRRITHPVRPASWTISLQLQAGNGDDVLMEALHGADWYERAGAPRGRYRMHLATVACTLAAVAAAVARQPRVAIASAAAALGLTADFAWRRIAPGPRTPREIATMLVTSVAIPFAAVAYRVRAHLGIRALLRSNDAPRSLPSAVLFDRDGTLVVDVPYNGDPSRVQPMPGARDALDRLRAAGVPIGVVTNQSGVAMGTITKNDVDGVHRRLDALLGPLDAIHVCTHAPADGCSCRKPAPGLIVDAARELGVDPRDCVVVGDIGSDMEAAHNAGARAILVPTGVTRLEEIEAATCVAGSLREAVDMLLGVHA